MDAKNIQLVRDSFPKVAVIASPAATLFYGRLFELDPSLRPLFAGVAMAAQGAKLMAAIGFVVSNLSRPERMAPTVRDMALRHVGYGVQREHYGTVGAALVWALEQGLAEDFTPELRAAWTQAYTTLAAIMTEAAYPVDAPAAA